MKSKFLLKTFIASLFFSTILFLSAGKINYFQGWIFLGTNLLTGLLNFYTIKNNEELMKERSNMAKHAKSWDKKLLGFSALIYVLNVVLAGLDSGRFQWSPKFHWSLYIVGVLLTLIGQAIFLTARNQNKYFSSVVRIQTDREHSVCDTGLYKIIRHPGYLGMSISLLSIPLLTGSLWCIVTTLMAIILLFARTYLEDSTLMKELSGYKEYALGTKSRLIPNIW